MPLHKLIILLLITPWSSILGMLIITQVAEKFHSTPSHPISLRFILIFPTMLRSSAWSLHFRFSDKNFVCLPHLCAPRLWLIDLINE
jgi:hypothetical protein